MVNVYVAVISAVAGIAGAAISQAFIIIRDSQQAERDRQERDRDRQERQAAERQEACRELLRAAVGLRTQVANNFDYHDGPEMRERLAMVREYAAAAQLHATSVSMLAPAQFAEPADQLAEAASHLAEAAAKNTKLDQSTMLKLPSFTELNKLIETFRRIAVGKHAVLTHDVYPVLDQPAGTRGRDAGGAAGDRGP
jgi:hypothetical protein